MRSHYIEIEDTKGGHCNLMITEFGPLPPVPSHPIDDMPLHGMGRITHGWEVLSLGRLTVKGGTAHFDFGLRKDLTLVDSNYHSKVILLKDFYDFPNVNEEGEGELTQHFVLTLAPGKIRWRPAKMGVIVGNAFRLMPRPRSSAR